MTESTVPGLWLMEKKNINRKIIFINFHSREEEKVNNSCKLLYIWTDDFISSCKKYYLISDDSRCWKIIMIK